ncbi:MAG: ABC transporter ATP-binding protein [Bacteroides sp.]|nr:ABC transporter ATP-binding protein [Bacteroides sp.]
MSHHYLRFEKVHYRYPDGHEALRGVSFCLHHGEKVALVGDNGAGKSTLLLHTNGLLLPESGRVVVGDIPVERHTLPLVRQRVGLLFQSPDDQLFMPTVADDVAFGPLNMRLPREEVERRVEQALRSVGAWELRHRTGMQLSGGEKRRVAIASVLSMEPDILVMDEPTSGLDRRARQQLMELIGGFRHTCFIATHDMEMVHELGLSMLYMEEGRILRTSADSSA